MAKAKSSKSKKPVELKLEDLQFLVLDEADEMLDMGFIEDIEQVLRAVPNSKRMLMFSAFISVTGFSTCLKNVVGRFCFQRIALS